MTKFKTLTEKISDKLHSLILSEDEKLSPLQKKYQEFFRKKLDEAGVSSPDKFKSDEDKKKFFDDVKKEWAKEKAK